ncbi:MAG TPA: GIY-YIG nuclease family protein [Gammaproteobacteria bacterium]|nr:GIY-YIG nuclease family protein [Gammaproteobacteria bacterium]
MLDCRDGRLYTGITTNIERRLSEHNAGRKGARFTRANPPVRLLAARQVLNRSAALKLEATLKKLSRPQKQRWAAENQVLGAVYLH